jgi:hypothetical protein
MNTTDKQIDLIGECYKDYVETSEPTLDGKYLSQPEFIYWIRTRDEFSKRWGITIETRELSNDEIINYFYTNIESKTKWKKDEVGRYFYFSESSDECFWVEHSTSDIIFGMKPLCPTKLTTINYNGQIQEIYE